VHGIPVEPGKRAGFIENNLLDRRVVAQHRDEGIAAASVGDSIGDLRAFCRQGFRLAARAIVDDDAMAGLEQVQRDRRTHVTEPNESYFHFQSSLRRARHFQITIIAGDSSAP
jgi:hypothetical protein